VTSQITSPNVGPIPGVLLSSRFKITKNVDVYVRRMFDGILSDVIGRDGHVTETGSGNNDDGRCADRLSDRWTQYAVSAVNAFKRDVTRCQNHALRMRHPAAVTSSPRSASGRQCDQEPRAATGVETSTPVSCSGTSRAVGLLCVCVFGR